MSNDGHVTDVGRLVHQTTDLLNGEAVERVDISNPIKICMVGVKAPSGLMSSTYLTILAVYFSN